MTVQQQTQTEIDNLPVDKISEMLANLEFRTQEPLSGVTYDQLEVGAGHPQGDLKIQYLGQDVSPGMLGVVRVGELLSNYVDYSIENSSHFLQGVVELYAPAQPHPLVTHVLYAPNGFSVTHDEHADVNFTVPGWYAFRFDRTGAVKAEEIAQQLRRTVD